MGTMQAKQDTKRRPGPKPRGEKESKRSAFTTRLTPETREALEQAAKNHNRSISQEAEFLLERALDREKTVFDTVYELMGGKATFRLMLVLARVVEDVEKKTGKPAATDWLTYEAIRTAINHTLEELAPQATDQERTQALAGASLLEGSEKALSPYAFAHASGVDAANAVLGRLRAIKESKS
jgi:hypothetical protein